jgi:NAD(P)-dependent dehydrogenase (short-subunit alcohol dehydrogenase family)
MSSPKAFTISPSDLKSPTDCVTLITGASSGIGLQTALLLHTLSPNNSLILLDLHPIAPQNVSAAFITSPRILFLQSDITSWPSQREAFEKGIQRFGKIDNVFVNAGIAEYGDQFFKDEVDGEGRLREPDRRVVDVDLQAAGDTVKLAVHYLRRNRERGGSVVLTASLAGYLASAGAPVYSAAKHGELMGLWWLWLGLGMV